MARITVWGDFKADTVDHLNLSGELQLLLNQSDINIVNFEAPVHSAGKPARKSGPNISQHVDAPQWLEDRGFNVVSLANNHVMDYGLTGLEKTLEGFKSARVIGAGEWDAAYQMTIVDLMGMKIGILAGTHCEFGTLTEKNDEIGCAWCMSPEFESQILNRGGVNYLIVINHGGVEYLDYPLPEWRETYEKWIDMGADAVIASHPHVPQGWEIYKGKPICYSLGNFCFQTGKIAHDHWNESLCCVLSINDGGKIDIEMKPIFYAPSSQYIYTENTEEYSYHLEKINRVLANKNEYENHINEAALSFLPDYYGMFSRSGFLNYSRPLSTLKGIVEHFNKTHVYNSIKCESHRWLIIRAMALKYNLK